MNAERLEEGEKQRDALKDLAEVCKKHNLTVMVGCREGPWLCHPEMGTLYLEDLGKLGVKCQL